MNLAANDSQRNVEKLDNFLSLRDILTVLFKHKTKILSVFFATTLTVIAGTFIMTPVYEAYSSILVKIGREHIYRPEIGTGNPAISIDWEATVNSEIQIATSHDLMQLVIEAIGVEKLYPDLEESPPADMTPLEAAILVFEEALSINQVSNSNVIEVSFEHESPEMSAQAVNQLIDFLKAKHLRIFSDPKASFLEKQVLIYEQNLNDSKSRLQKFKQEYGLSSHEEEGRLKLGQRKDLDITLKTAEHEMQSLGSKLTALREQMKNTPKEIPLTSVSEQHRVIDEAKSDLLDHRRKEQELLTKYKESSRLVVEVRKEIELIEEFIKEQGDELSDRVTTGKNPVYQQIEMQALSAESELHALLSKQKVLKRQIQDLDTKLARHGELGKELADLEHDVELDQQNYEMYLNKVEEARISEEMDRLNMANISVIQSAIIPAEPIRPKKALNIVLGIFLGAAAGIALAFISEYLEGGYTRPEQAARDLGLPVLASISHKG